MFGSRCSTCDLAPFGDESVVVSAPPPTRPACAARGRLGVERASAAGAATELVDIELPVNASRFDHVAIGRATDLVPRLLELESADP
jgi:hypothetical protein